MKNRLTITLSSKTLARVDQLIDGQRMRNRSHAIERLIEQSLQPTLKTAVILAGGVKNEDSFKPLTVIDGKPLILHTIALLKKHGLKHLIIATNAQGKKLQELLKDGAEYDLDIEYSFEQTPQGTGGALKKIASRLPADQPFLVVAGDILTSIDLTELVAFHLRNKALVTMAVKPRPTHKMYDNVFMQGHTVVDFQHSSDDQVVSIVNAGVYVFESSVVSSIPEEVPVMLEKDVFPKLAKTGQMVAFPFQGVWFDISTDTNYQQALERTL